jgi:hypothetical protein
MIKPHSFVILAFDAINISQSFRQMSEKIDVRLFLGCIMNFDKDSFGFF